MGVLNQYLISSLAKKITVKLKLVCSVEYVLIIFLFFLLFQVEAFFKIGRGELPLIPNSLSEEARDFIKRCLQINPDDRPSAAQLLKHPFVNRSRSDSSGSAQHSPMSGH